MKFYRENNINPAASCLPMLAQLPVFFALYFVLRQFAKHRARRRPLAGSASSRTSPHTASAHWSGYLLLAIYVVSQMASTYFMSTTMEKTQRYLMMALPLFFITLPAQLPGRPPHLLGDDEPVDGRPGLVTRRLVPKTPAPPDQRRSSRTPPKDEGDGGGNGAKTDGPEPKPAPSAQQARPQRPQQVRRKKKKGGARPVSDVLRVEATGETVGEAKWQALRELERLRPDLDKAAVRFQVVSEGERGLLGVGYAPARVVAVVGRLARGAARATRAPRPPRVRELLERFAAELELALPRRGARGRGVDRRLLHRPRPRPADRQARPDDRRDPVPRERDRAPRSVRRRASRSSSTRPATGPAARRRSTRSPSARPSGPSSPGARSSSSR